MKGVLIAVLLCLAGGEEWVRPYDLWLPGTEPEGIVAVRVLGERDGALVPIPGAACLTYTEEVSPRVRRARLYSDQRTDQFGFVNVRDAACAFHWIFSAPGFAPVSGRDDEIVLRRAIDTRVVVLDPAGQPVAGARVEQFLGCPHSPDVLGKVTDDEGGFPLPLAGCESDGEFWVIARGVARGPYSPTPPQLGRPVWTLRTDPARTVAGRVIDAEGKPLPGVVVRALRRYPRGPVTTTGHEGRFELTGVEAGQPLWFYDPRASKVDWWRPAATVAEFTEGVPLVVRLPAAVEVRHRVEVRVFLIRRFEDASGIPVRLTRLSDGFTVVAGTVEFPAGIDVPGLALAEVPPGEYRVAAGGGDSAFLPAYATVTVPGDPVEFLLDSKPEPEEVKETVLEPTEVRLTFVDARGDALDVEEVFVWGVQRVPDHADPRKVEDGMWSFRTRRAGLARLEILADDYPDVYVTVDLPEEAGTVLYLDPVVLRREDGAEKTPPPGRIDLTVVGEDGVPLDAVIYLDDRRFRAKGGKLAIEGVEEGPHLLLAGARGHRGEARRIVLAASPRSLALTLPRK